MRQERVVIIGAGFGGLAAARRLAKHRHVTLIDQQNHHLFQPLLYQVATAGLSPAQISRPTRRIFRKEPAVRCVMARVTAIDLEKKEVCTTEGPEIFDRLIIAVGAQSHYFGNDHWEAHAPGLKTLADATEIRARILRAFERAEAAGIRAEQDALLRFVVVGGGPTGVEMAGAIVELGNRVLRHDFRTIDPTCAEVILVEGSERLLESFDPDLSDRTRRDLEDMGVTVRCGERVTEIDAESVRIGDERIETRTVIWAAGVQASPGAEWLDAETGGGGRILVDENLLIKGHDCIYAIGDCAETPDNAPGLAPAAQQMGEYVADHMMGRAKGPFRYLDKGQMATIGRSRAIAQSGKFKMAGFIAWLAWLFIHLITLVGFRNRLSVMREWFWKYITWERGARLIVDDKDGPPDPD